MSITQEEHPTILQGVLFLSGDTGVWWNSWSIRSQGYVSWSYICDSPWRVRHIEHQDCASDLPLIKRLSLHQHFLNMNSFTLLLSLLRNDSWLKATSFKKNTETMKRSQGPGGLESEQTRYPKPNLHRAAEGHKMTTSVSQLSAQQRNCSSQGKIRSKTDPLGLPWATCKWEVLNRTLTLVWRRESPSGCSRIYFICVLKFSWQELSAQTRPPKIQA